MKKYFTKEGLELKYREIKAQEEKLKTIGKEVGEASGPSYDWHDNFGYEDAQRRFEMELMNLKRLKEEFSSATIIAVPQQSERVAIGVTVKVSIGGEEKEFTIGAFGEFDPNKGLITYNSPLGSALMGMKIGETKTTRIGDKTVEIEINAIFPPSYRYNQLIEQILSRDSVVKNNFYTDLREKI